MHIGRKILNGSLIKDLISKDFLILTPEIRLSYQINLTLSQCKTKKKIICQVWSLVTDSGVQCSLQIYRPSLTDYRQEHT